MNPIITYDVYIAWQYFQLDKSVLMAKGSWLQDMKNHEFKQIYQKRKTITVSKKWYIYAVLINQVTGNFAMWLYWVMNKLAQVIKFLSKQFSI